jgi:Alpha/beta hydrolase domain
MSTELRAPRWRHLPGGAPIPAGSYDLATVGYHEREFLIEGEAQSFALVGERSTDGQWEVAPAADAAYTSRLVIRAPIDPARFSGTAVVEWNNVSGGIDIGPEWMFFHRYLVAAGHVWVGVTAQKAGIDGGGIVEGLHLKVLDPQRYDSLRHPGDAWSFDIFSQVGSLLRSAEDDSPLGSLVAARLVAAGESQSAAFLVTYINAVDPGAEVFDGYFVHGRPGTGASLDGTFVARRGAVADTARSELQGRERIRADVRVPVMVLQSETDVVLLGGGQPAQPDGSHLRLWEISGAAHADTYLLVASQEDDGNLSSDRLAQLMQPTTDILAGHTDTPINSGPQQHYIGQAALDWLIRWSAGGPPPPGAARLQVDETHDRLIEDDFGIAVGGIRTPWVDIPTSRLSGLGQTGETFAVLFGTTEPFDGDALAARYPGGRAEYLDDFSASLDSTITAGFILAGDRAEIIGLAGASYPEPIGGVQSR